MTRCIVTLDRALNLVSKELAYLFADISSVTERGDARLNGMARVTQLREIRTVLLSIELPPVDEFDNNVRGEEVTFHRYESKRITRSNRRDNAVAALRAIATTLEKRLGYALARSLIEAAVSQLTQLNFPKYYLKGENHV